MNRPLVVRDLGTMPYAEALALQLRLVEQRARGEIADHLLFVEHESIVTIGRGADRSAVAGVSLPIVEVSRGGEATWHGPGQLVGYPILQLEDSEHDLHRYLRDLEEVLIRSCRELEIEAARNPPHTGVWIGAKKVASIGVAVKRWVTYHGFALNVDSALDGFGGFQPCGLASSVMTSLAREGVSISGSTRGAMKDAIVRHFLRVFSRSIP